MSREKVEISTPDGTCPATVFRPDDDASHPAVIFYMDGLGIRPAILDMGERLASYGYVVLMPDLFYRYGPYAPMVPKDVFATGDVRKAVGPYMSTTSNQKAGEDTRAFLAYLDSRGDIQGTKIGTTGYCMGGGMSLTAAGLFPGRVAAAASFHGGGLATDSPMSPHLLASKMKASVYVAGADQDSSYPPEQAELLERSLSAAGVAHRCEIYAGALHGWTMTDFPVYEPESAERHWTELTGLYAGTLG
ncbi:MAG: dienelactone hydrolase family protein [Gammaproteobacteria bacterium]|nr:dienelactone hydrolase family protein [Gammaproteobacteria bacterium]